jgi:hypothetical protein
MSPPTSCTPFLLTLNESYTLFVQHGYVAHNAVFSIFIIKFITSMSMRITPGNVFNTTQVSDYVYLLTIFFIAFVTYREWPKSLLIETN